MAGYDWDAHVQRVRLSLKKRDHSLTPEEAIELEALEALWRQNPRGHLTDPKIQAVIQKHVRKATSRHSNN